MMASLHWIAFLLFISSLDSVTSWGHMFDHRIQHPAVLTRPRHKPGAGASATTIDPPEVDVEEQTTQPYYDYNYNYNYKFFDYPQYNYNNYGGSGPGAGNQQFVPTTVATTTTPDPTEAPEIEQSQTVRAHCICSLFSTCPRGSIPRGGACDNVFSLFNTMRRTRCCYRPSVAKRMPLAD